jgi:hypothetical protein
MPSSASTSALRQLFETRLSQFSTELETLFAQAREKGRAELADQLNQAVRRMRLAPDLDELGATLVDAAGAFCAGAALFRVDDGHAAGQRVRGVSEETAAGFASLRIPLSSAAALRGAIESCDPVTAVAAEQEVSPQLVALFAHDADARAVIYPLLVREEVAALLYVWDAGQTAPVELLTQVAGCLWSALEPPPVPEAPAPAPSELVQLAAPSRKAARPWESFSPDEQKAHLRAQRFARVQVSEMRLQEAEAVQSGRSRGDIYGALRSRIDSARETMRRDFFAACPGMVDYLHVELVRTLAYDHAELLGKDYPGPMV